MKKTTNLLTRSRFVIAAIIVIIAIQLAPTSSNATTLASTNLAKLAESAESAFVIQIDSMEITTTDKGKSVDQVKGTVIDPIFGKYHTSETVTWNQFRISGKVGMPAMPKYEPGKEYLIFLSGPGPETGYQSPMGLGQGTFTLRKNPATGEVIAQSLYGNSTLTMGLDVNTVTNDIVARDTKTRSMSTAQRQAETNKIKAQLTSPRAGINLDIIKSAARMFHQQKQNGRNPVIDYRTTTSHGRKLIR